MNADKVLRSALKHYRDGKPERAERELREILEALPGHFEARYYLANILHDTQRLEEAEACYRESIKLRPDFAGSYYNLASLMHERGRLDEALPVYQKVIEMDPGYADAYNTVGVIFQAEGHLNEAEAHYRRAIALDPAFAMAYTNLGNLLFKKGRIQDAVGCHRKAIQLQPDYAKAYCGLGIALQEEGRLDEAEANYRKALQLEPGLSEAFSNLGRIFHAKGQFDKAERYYRSALRLKKDPLCYSNLLLLMNYSSHYTARAVFDEHLQFAKQIAGHLVSDIRPHTNDRSATRRLKIGYVSPDFRRHSVNYFLEPVLASCDHECFEIFCYSDVVSPDDVTSQLKKYADRWRDITGMPDEKAAELIREDGIDILLDLAGHTGLNRMLLFARKPAPVQVSWLGYPNTTGLPTIDYRIVDSYTDPPGLTDPFYTEKLVRMPGSFLCYQADEDSPAVCDLSALSSGHITFGSFNNFTKVTPDVLSLWSGLLKRAPGSRLVLKAKSLSDRGICVSVSSIFKDHGIDPARIELLGHEASFSGHLALYNRIDIGLDSFPYGGTTTTCEALWMGVPVVTLEGNTHASRVGVSLLSNIGFPEFIAETPNEYVEIAVDLAADIDRLQSIRRRLRDTMKQSPLMNAEQFTLNLESSYRRMWEDWCNSGG